MLPKKKRLPTKIIKNIFEQKLKPIFKDDTYQVFLIKNYYTYPRLGIIVTQKSFKTAVKRNKLKRQVKAILWKLIKEKRLRPADYLFIIRKEVKNFEKIENDLRKIINEISG